MSASDWIWEVDGHFVFTYLSVRFRDVTGYQPEAWIGRRLTCATRRAPRCTQRSG